MRQDELRKAALERLHGILERLASPVAVIRHPDGVVQTDDGVEMPAAEYARLLAESVRSGGFIAMPTTRGYNDELEWDIEFPAGQGAAALNGLAWLLGLTGQEQVFVRSLMDDPTDQVGIFAFADWLEEQGRIAEATRVRKAAEGPAG